MDIEDIVNYAILIGVAVAIILLLTGKFIDLSVLRQESLQTRETINLLQDIVTSGPFLVTDSGGNPMKLLIDKSKFPTADITQCCDNVKYDYKFGISDTAQQTQEVPRTGYHVESSADLTKTNFFLEPNFKGTTGSSPLCELTDNGGSRFALCDYCYTGFGVNGKYASTIPVNVCDKNDPNTCKQGLAAIETTDTPLSELSYWITQACELNGSTAAPGFDLDLTKRITLSMDDYKVGNDLNVTGQDVCFKGICKKITCGDVKVDVQQGPLGSNGKSKLYNQEVPRWPLPARCNFVIVNKTKEGVHIMVPFLPTPTEMPINEGGMFFFPADQDAWTETYTNHMLVLPSDHEVKLSLDGVPASKGSSYIAVMRTPTDSMGDVRINMQMSAVKDRVDTCLHDQAFDPTTDTVNHFAPTQDKCVNMDARGLDKIFFKARVAFDDPSDKNNALLTWKLFDSNGRCIQRTHNLPLPLISPSGKDIINANDWTTVEIDRAGAQQNYGGCILGTSLSDTINRGIHTGDYPQDFDWNITNVEFDACELNVGGTLCIKELGLFGAPLIQDTIKSVMIDNFYFQGTRKQ